MRGKRETDMYPGRVFLHFVLAGVVGRYVTAPETALAQLVVGASLALIAETHHGIAVAVAALDWMEYWEETR